MMKKLFIVLILILSIAALPVVLTACSKISADKLMEPAWGTYERLDFNVARSDSDGNVVETGTYFSTIQTVSNTTVTVGSKQISVGKGDGYVVYSELNIGNTKQTSSAFMYKMAEGDKRFSPAASFTEKFEDGVLVYSQMIEYTSSKAECTVVENGEKKTDSLPLSAIFYDNVTLYYTLRTFPLDEATSVSFSLALPFDESAKMTASFSGGANQKITNTSSAGLFGSETVDCYGVQISRKTQMQGSNYLAYYAGKKVTIDERSVSKLPVKIVENSTVYELVSVKTVAPTGLEPEPTPE